jgi:DNA polymerase V
MAFPKSANEIRVSNNNGGGGGCADKEPYALRAIGDSMAPEFEDGDILIIDPSYAAQDGVHAILEVAGEYHFRQLLVRDGTHYMHALNPAFPDQALGDNWHVHGVVVQRTRGRNIVHFEYPGPGEVKRYEHQRSLRRRPTPSSTQH